MKTALVLIAALASKSLAAAVDRRQAISPSCTEIKFPVTVTATNAIIPVTTPITFQHISGTYHIAARYCEPQNIVKSRQNTLQVLVHGITYTRNYWSADGVPGPSGVNTEYQPALYSWVDYASGQGYPTLAIDRLGNGLSDHPDPVSVLQSPIHVEVLHQIITLARAGSLPMADGRKFNKIIYAGHSYGSVIANNLNTKYPADADATILTGLATSLNTAFLVPLIAALEPAATANPAKWSNLNAGYLAFFNKTAYQQAYWYPPFFDTALQDLDYKNIATVGVGELQSALVFYVTTATNYKNPILDITGQHDALMCTNPDPLAITKPYPTFDCGSGKTSGPAETKSLYPNANYDYYVPSASGHCWHLHYQGFDGFAYAHNWLNHNRF